MKGSEALKTTENNVLGDKNYKWPPVGRVTLRDEISRRKIGQNPDVKSPKSVTDGFASENKNSKAPSPSKK